VDLYADIPGFILSHGAELEVVHGAAAERLDPYQGIGALLKERA
jgi:hypothetical protein